MKTMRAILYFSVTATMLATTNAHATDCRDKLYRYTHPNECQSWGATGTILMTAAAAIGGGALLFVTSDASGGISSTPSPMPTISTYNYNLVGGDVDSAHLAGIMGNDTYTQNTLQYNDIRAAYSMARGFTGRGSKIAILDTGTDTWHGRNVAYIAANTVAPNATITSYKITNSNYQFISYGEIGNVINRATDANIYNASWSVEMRASDIHSGAQIAALTDTKFIGAITNAATNRDAIFVWAAGNDSAPESSALSAMPLVIPELNGHFVNVVAWDSDAGTLADYSNMCGITRDWCITAPGNINTDKTTVFGTSFAAPVVSAAIATIREAFPYMTASQITSLLFETARDLGDPGVDDVYGHGMLDMEHATRPQGVALVPIDENASVTTPMRAARVSGTIGHSVRKMDLKMAYLDSYGRPFQTRLNDNISVKNPGRAFERLRMQTMPSAKIGNMEFGMRNTDLLFSDGFMSANSQTPVGFIAINNNHKIGDIDLFTRTQFAAALPQASDNSLITDFSNIYMASINIGAKIHNWHITFGIPDSIISGNMNLHLPTDRGRDGKILYQDHTINLATRPAFEYSVGYKNITATFIDNPYGTDEFFIMTRGHISF